MNIPLPNKKSASTDSPRTAASTNPSTSSLNGTSIPDIMSEDHYSSNQYANHTKSLHREDISLSFNQQLDQVALQHAQLTGDNTQVVSERARVIFQKNNQGVEEKLTAKKEELRIYNAQLKEHELVVSNEPINIPNEDKQLSKTFKISRGISYARIIARFGVFDCDTILKAAAFPI